MVDLIKGNKMSIRKDNWIRQPCELPIHVIQYAIDSKEFASKPIRLKQKQFNCFLH